MIKVCFIKILDDAWKQPVMLLKLLIWKKINYYNCHFTVISCILKNVESNLQILVKMLH